MGNKANSDGMPGAGVGGLFFGMAIGALIGGVLALLYAPQRGTQTREMIRTRASMVGNAFRGVTPDSTSEKVS